MRIRRYVAASLDEAVERVRKELGRDAVILEVRRVRAPGLGGWFKRRRIEVTAAADHQPASAPVPPVRKLPAPGPGKPTLRQPSVNIRPAATPLVTSENMIPEPLRTSYVLARDHTDQLINRGVQPDLARKVVEKALAALPLEELNNSQALEKSVNKVITDYFIPQNHKQSAGRTIAFVGPTGVGKTTTIAKLAAIYKLQQGKEVVLATTDTYRIAAVDQLRRYAEILHVPLEVIYTVDDLKAALDRHWLAGMILIDTAGRSPQQELYLAEVKNLLNEIPAVHTVLVVSATTKMDDIELICDRFRIFDPNEVVLTKIDETRSAGTLLNLVDRLKVPVTYVCNGQNVPDDLMVANPQLLANLVLGGARHG
ncbi:MAG: flagellar biosynthesis protein FlhF [Firmicutes bacterium]|nr:flagellar biosynthesis protein FlhF [Bacillota bacterium]